MLLPEEEDQPELLDAADGVIYGEADAEGIAAEPENEEVNG